MCAHPINLCNSLGSGLSDLHHCVGCGRGPWLESVINFPFLPVALSRRPSLFPLGDSDIRHNSYEHCDSCHSLSCYLRVKLGVSPATSPHSCPATQLCPTPCTPCMPGFPVLHHLPELAQTHVHWVSDAIQPSHPLLSPSPPALNLSQDQGLFQWVGSSCQVAKGVELQLQHQSFQWTPRTDLL